MAITEKNQLSDKRNYKTKSGFLTIKKILEGGSRLSIWSLLFLPGLVITNSSLPASYSPRPHPWLPTADRRERTPEMIPSDSLLLPIIAFSRSQMKKAYIGNLSLLSPPPPLNLSTKKQLAFIPRPHLFKSCISGWVLASLCRTIKTESIRKLSNFNFQRTKSLYQNNLKNVTF